MKLILAIVVAMAVAWGGYWVIGSRLMQSGIENWLDDRAADGWVVNRSDVSTTGFPNRFDTTISDLELADPDTGLAWTAPFFQILTLSYNTRHIIAVWPHEQMLSSPYQTVKVATADMRGSLVFDRGDALPLNRTTVDFEGMVLSSSLDWSAQVDQGQLAVRRTPDATNSYDIALDASGLVLPRPLLSRLGRDANEEVELLRLDATVGFDAPWDRYAIEDARPQPNFVDLRLAQAKWGNLDLRFAGKLQIDPDGIPAGEIVIKATNWREILEIARATGAIPEAIYPLVERGLKALAGLSGNPDTLDVALQFNDGRTTLGGLIPLGSAPRMRLR